MNVAHLGPCLSPGDSPQGQILSVRLHSAWHGTLPLIGIHYLWNEGMNDHTGIPVFSWLFPSQPFVPACELSPPWHSCLQRSLGALWCPIPPPTTSLISQHTSLLERLLHLDIQGWGLSSPSLPAHTVPPAPLWPPSSSLPLLFSLWNSSHHPKDDLLVRHTVCPFRSPSLIVYMHRTWVSSWFVSPLGPGFLLCPL